MTRVSARIMFIVGTVFLTFSAILAGTELIFAEETVGLVNEVSSVDATVNGESATSLQDNAPSTDAKSVPQAVSSDGTSEGSDERGGSSLARLAVATITKDGQKLEIREFVMKPIKRERRVSGLREDGKLVNVSKIIAVNFPDFEQLI